MSKIYWRSVARLFEFVFLALILAQSWALVLGHWWLVWYPQLCLAALHGLVYGLMAYHGAEVTWRIPAWLYWGLHLLLPLASVLIIGAVW